MGAGFEGPSEALFLGKSLVVFPMKGQYEQQCNAAALSQLGVTSLKAWDPSAYKALDRWIDELPVVRINYPDETAQIIEEIESISKKVRA